MGAPARTPSGAEVDHGFRVGDLVQFHFTSLEAMARNTWEDGKAALWIPQENVDAVWYTPPEEATVDEPIPYALFSGLDQEIPQS
jgi:hypothetical protein